MRLVLILFSVLFLYSAQVDTKIKNTKKTLIQTNTQISNMNNALDKIVKKINNSEKYLNNINKQITKLNKQIKELQYSLQTNKGYLNNLIVKKNSLIKKRDNLQKEVIDFISNNYYIQKQNISSVKDLINEEILKSVTKQSAKKMENISHIYTQIDNQIMQISIIIHNIKNSKIVLQNRKNEVNKLKIKQKQNIKELQAIKLKYKKELQKIISNQNKLQNQLSKLNIIKEQEIKKQREIAANRLKEKKKRLKQKIKQKQLDKVKVKNYGNIYMSSKTIRYKGKKTFAPLKGVITKKFGAYTDPVYHINLYNDSITIKVDKLSKVRAIFSGRVVFVGDTNEGKMIVIKHNNRLHSIYAKLSKVSPFIRKGYRVKKGEIIAKVDNELEFEVTYKTLPINPLQVIKF